MSENKLDESKSNIEMGSFLKDGSGNKTANGTPSTSLKKKDKGQKDEFEVIKPPERGNTASNAQNNSSNNIGGPPWKKIIFNILNHNYVVIFMTLVTVWALISDDTRVLVTNKNGDATFYILTAICFVLFALEVILGAIAKPDYFMSFFFFLDVLSTITLALDIGWVMDALTGTDSSTASGNSKNTQKQAQLAKAGKASRVGARAARIVRIVRLIRLIRVVKLYKHAQQVMNEKKIDDEDEYVYPADGSRPAIESGAIGAQRNESANQKAIEAGANGIVLPNPEISGSANGFKINPAVSSSGNKLGEELPKKDGIEQPADQNGVQATNGQVAPADGQPINRSMTIAQSGQVNQSNANVEDDVPKESNVSKKLSDLTIRRVIVLVLAIMISIPVFSADTWTSTDTSYNAGLQIVYSFISNNDTTSTNFLISLNTYINEHSPAAIRDPMVLFSMNIPYITDAPANLSYTFYSVANVGNVDFQTDSGGNASLNFPGSNAANYSNSFQNITDVTTMRSADLSTVTAQDNSGNPVGYAQFDTSADSFMNAWLGLIRTVFVCLVLTVGAVLFTQDATDLVLTPIEEMLKKVKRIAANPIEAVQIDEQEAYERELIEAQLATSGKTDELKEKDKAKPKKVNYETEILEKLISKIGALLALGFGEAGSEIIAKNMAGAGEVDPMIPGKKIQAIFGFCDIRNFTDATEVLQEGVMVFVNEIAEIVHSTVDRFCGSANKNIGDAFLLVWKFPEELIEDDPEKPGECRLKKMKQVNMFSDLALIAFLKIIGRINSSPKLEKYKHNPGLNARLPNYSVKMGFGLHCGWAIEGAIGSDFKIDASYLSPNVNMASRLEAATKQFGVPILVSGPLRNIMTEEVHKEMRHIDRVTVKGSVDPVDFYTVDLDFHKLGINHKEPDLSQMPKKERKLRKLNARKKRNELKKNIVDGKKKISDMFKTDKELVLMRSSFPASFKAEFEQGLQHYLDGKWDQARTVFEKTLNMIPNHKDGPSQTLLDVIIHENGGKVPSDWGGFRPLTEK